MIFKINNFCCCLYFGKFPLTGKGLTQQDIKEEVLFFGTTWFESVWSTWVSNFFLHLLIVLFSNTFSWLESSGPGCGRQCGKLFARLTGSAGHATTCAWTINAQAQGRTSSTCCHLASDLKKIEIDFYEETWQFLRLFCLTTIIGDFKK